VIHAWRELANPRAGGSERHIDQLARGMVERGHEVLLVAGGPVSTHPYRVVCSGGTYTQYLNVPRVDRYLRDVDLVLDEANGMTYCSPLWRKGPVVLLQHHLHLEQWATHFPKPLAAMGRLFESRVAPRVYRDRLVVVSSPSTGTSLSEVGYDPELVRVVVPGIVLPDRSEIPPDKASTPEFVTIGRLMPYKRVDAVLDVWRRVRPQVGGILHIVGDGPQRSALEAMDVPGVVFHGHVDEDEKLDLLARSWLLVHGAMHEGWGIVITEAGALGTPTLAFDVPGVRDAVAHEMSGVLAEDRAAMVKEWVSLAHDTARRRQLGDGARTAAGRHSEKASGDAFEAVCLEAVERHGTRRR
jgi:glycosyltransferase involved in cell wall biosynthesis